MSYQERNMKKRIGIIESGFMSNYLQDFINCCEQNGIEIDLFSYYRNSNYAKYAKKVYRLKEVYLPKKIKSKQPLENEIKKLVDINSYDYILTDCMGLSFACNIFHNISLTQRMAITPNFLYRKLLQFSHKKQIEHEKYYYRNCPKTVVVSNYLKQDYAKNCGINSDSIIVAYPGTNNEHLLNYPSQKNKNIFTVGAVTCGFVTKGGYNVLNALRILKKIYSPAQLRVRIINPNYQKQKILHLYLKFFNLTKYVDLIPYQKDINKFYKTLDCLVCASNYEAFGRIVTEGMLCNVPVIVGSNVGAADIIKEGENGFIFDAKYPAKNLAQKIEEVIKISAKQDNTLESITQKAAQTAKQLSWANFAQNIFYGLYPEFK